jgi:hypothetical protein
MGMNEMMHKLGDQVNMSLGARIDLLNQPWNTGRILTVYGKTATASDRAGAYVADTGHALPVRRCAVHLL